MMPASDEPSGGVRSHRPEDHPSKEGPFRKIGRMGPGCTLDELQHPLIMRYRPEHKAEIHHKIVKDASRRIRAQGLNGAAVAAVLWDTGLTHGGFYKDFGSKNDLLAESLSEAVREFTNALVNAAEQSPPAAEWKAIVKTYLSPEHCEHPEHGCPLATLAPELARADKGTQHKIVAQLVNYKSQMLPFHAGSANRGALSLVAFFNDHRGD